MNLTKDEQEVINKMRAKKDEEQAAQNFPIRSLDSFSVEEKIEAFDKFYNDALDTWNENKSKGYHSEDDSHYTWEAVMRLLAPKGKIGEFWKAFNKLGHSL